MTLCTCRLQNQMAPATTAAQYTIAMRCNILRLIDLLRAFRKTRSSDRKRPP